MKAAAIKRMLDMRGDALLFELDPPYYSNKYVVSSAIENEFAMETYLFAADEEGNITNWLELPGSVRYVYDPYLPFVEAGYDVSRL